MCPPRFFGIEYEINPWMNVAVDADHHLATRQWHDLHDQLLAAGAHVECMDPLAGLPDLVFTANAALIFRQTAVLARFRHPQRQRETPVDRQWLESNGFECVEPPSGFSFEGAGDALFCGDTLFAGYRQRSDAAGHQKIAAMLDVRVLPVELVSSSYYHLDTCFCPLSATEAIWFPEAFDTYGRRAIELAVPELIEVVAAEAAHFACNAVVVGKTVITNTGCEQLHQQLQRRGYRTIATPLSEFLKAGGSAKCLTLRLDGEDAAGWANTP
jgi:N-dimethylarginine dimethylaminohydrolase